jgi:hypothetical protein
MPFQKLVFRPGINTQRTPTLNEGGWSSSNLIRFKEGLPETKGGWVMFLQSALQGIIRMMHAWDTLSGTATLGVGTNLRLYVAQGGTAYDVTPIAQTTTPTNPFTTVNGQTTVTVDDSALTVVLTPGSFVEISGASAVGGITLAGEYPVVAVNSSTEYTITAATPATSGATGGGTPTIEYLLPAGPADASLANGWGSGPWGDGTWGTPRSGSSTGVIFPRLWTIDNWGENMLACPRGGSIYQWVAASGLTVRAAILTNAPTTANGVLVSAPLQMVIAFGCNPPAGGSQDPMLIAWSDEGDNTVWAPSATNQAGSFRLNNGSQIMQVLTSQQQTLIWTDTALYAMQYIGPPLVWSFVQLGTACGAISPNAAAVIGGTARWMSNYEFWTYDGTTHPVDCEIRDLVFKNINAAQQSKIFAGVNTQFSEIAWFYPSASSNENDSAATQNIAEGEWYPDQLSRTAWIDDNVFGNPIGGDANGDTWSHETGYTVNGMSMPWSITSADLYLSDGENYVFVDMILPDQIMTGDPVAYTFFARNYPDDTPVQYGPYIVRSSTEFIPLRIRARQVAIQISNAYNTIGVFWRHGAVRARIAPDGRQ